MKGIVYEYKKYVLTKKNLITVIGIVLAMAGLLCFKEGGYFSEKATRQTFFSQMNTPFSEMDKKEMQREKDKCEQQLFDNAKEGKSVKEQNKEKLENTEFPCLTNMTFWTTY